MNIDRNTYQGNATINNGGIKFENIVGTSTCNTFKTEEQKYFAALEKVDGAEIIGSRLFFYCHGKRKMVFYKTR